LLRLFERSASGGQGRAKTRAVAEATAVAKQFADNDLARTAFDRPLYSRGGTVTYAADRNVIGSVSDDAEHAHAAGATAGWPSRSRRSPGS
jgi:hypothetical protein